MSARDLVKAVLPKRLRRTLKASLNDAQAQVRRIRNRLKRPNLFRMDTAERVGIVYSAPSEMSISERLFLYSLVRGTRPIRVIEIGSRRGGSACIMAAAMEDSGQGLGLIVGVDPEPIITVPQRLFYKRFRLISKPSPDALPEARELAGGPFDLALIDGLHIYDQAKLDLEGILPHMSDNSYLLLHDAFHYGVTQAVSEALERHPLLHDCGYVCARPAVRGLGVMAYGGFRLLHKRHASSAHSTTCRRRSR
jgi:predicted O-methyltransferase YrrM